MTQGENNLDERTLRILIERGYTDAQLMAAMSNRTPYWILKTKQRFRQSDEDVVRENASLADLKSLAKEKIERRIQEIDFDAAPKSKKRKCLKCSTEFQSEHAGHRICMQCSRSKVFGLGQQWVGASN